LRQLRDGTPARRSATVQTITTGPNGAPFEDAVWPQLAELPGYEAYAARMNAMPKYVASRTLSGPLQWNATLLEGELTDSVTAVKKQHRGEPGRHRRRRAGPRAHHPEPGRRDLVLASADAASNQQS